MRMNRCHRGSALVCLGLLACSVVQRGDAGAEGGPPARASTALAQLCGVWRVQYDSGAVRTYVFQQDGTVQFVEEARRCTLCLRPELLLAFNDGKLERLVLAEDGLHVEH